MTISEARSILHCPDAYGGIYGEKYGQALAVAFKSLEALKQADVLDKIRAEILKEKECAYADFERYKVEYLGQDWEDALDSLPQDDFRYGMERAVEIIDKYKAERSGAGCR